MLEPQLMLIKCFIISIVFLNRNQVSTYEASRRCLNPNRSLGQCVSIYQCPTLLGIIRSGWSSSFGFARKSQCSNGVGRRPFVCCTSDTYFVDRTDFKGERIYFPTDDDVVEPLPDTSTTTTKRPSQRPSNDLYRPNQLLPKPPVCGPISVVNKIFGGEEAELGEFPWLANLEHRKANGDLVSVCAGSIINPRYVLTAAHCIKGNIEKKVGRLVSLRVGDHNTQSSVDCNNLGCIDPFQRLNVERLIVHPNFNNNPKIYNIHDIALIRTDRNIMYSDTVAPVCLPDVMPSPTPLRAGMKLTVAGWGHNGTVKYTAEKRKVEVPYVESSKCGYPVAEGQLCAGGEFRKDSCTGDSGGSLARLTADGWFVEGIVSYGRGCGLETPAVYTRVASYIQWIHSNVQF